MYFTPLIRIYKDINLSLNVRLILFAGEKLRFPDNFIWMSSYLRYYVFYMYMRMRMGRDSAPHL